MAKITGQDAIRYAEEHGLTLRKFASATEDARDGVTIEEAKRIAAEDPSLIWVSDGTGLTMAAFINHIPALPKAGQSGKYEAADGSLWIFGRHAGKSDLFFRREVYVPEGHDDDDLSVGSFYLPAKMGLSRRGYEVSAPTRDQLVERVHAHFGA